MTALKEFQRLESTGLWRPTPEAQRREVVVSFGDATLVLSDTAGRPITHWSLPAVERLNPGALPALYSPDPSGEETIEVEDDTMIGAIEKVRRSLGRRRPRPGRLRHVGIAGTVAVTLAVALLWLPGALTRQTLTVVPPTKRAEVGATLLGHIQQLTGPTCRNVLGTQALARLKTRLMGRDTPGQIVVVPEKLQMPVYLPGRIVVLDRAMVEGADDPAVIAGHVIAALAGRAGRDPLEAILREAGLGTTLRLLTTGDIPPGVLDAHAETVVTRPAAPPPDAALRAAFAAAEVPVGPYAAAAGRGTQDLSPAAVEGYAPVLSDADWISLQGICS